MFVGNREMARIAELEADVKLLRSQLEEANSKLETALAHNVCAGWEIKTLKERVNSKSNKTKRKVQVNAQYISSADAVQMLIEQEREEAEKKQKEEEVRAAKKAKDDHRKQQREAGGVTFGGSLNGKTKDDLLDIAFAMRLTSSDSNTPETKATLISIINAHLDANSHLAADPTFAGLFLSRTRARKRNDENSPPLAHSEPDSEHPMVLFNELPPSGRFFQSINLMPPNLSLQSSSPFAPFVHYPPPSLG